MSYIKLVNLMVYLVVRLNQSSKLSFKYMYIYMGKSKLYTYSKPFINQNSILTDGGLYLSFSLAEIIYSVG